METAFLYRLIENPALLTQETLAELKEKVNKYPTFSLLRMLYLKNLSVLNDAGFNSELEQMTVYIPDRRKLFILIEDKLYGQSSITMEKETERTDAFALIDSFLSSQAQSFDETDASLLFHAPISADYLLLSKGPEAAEESVGFEHDDLIESFIEDSKKRTHRASSVLGQRTAQGSLVAKNDDDVDSAIQQDESFFTETLAYIYIKQKRYERALQIIRKLNLKYPEKNVYFADQISFLEKLIINDNKIN